MRHRLFMMSARHSDDGFTFVELSVSALLLSLLIVAVAILMTTSTQSTRKTSKFSEQLALIDSDLSRIRSAAQTYTACPSGTLSVQPINCPHAFGTSNYYFPDPSVVASGPQKGKATQGRINFIASCTNGTFPNGLISYINTSLPVSSRMTDLGIIRVTQKDDTTSPSSLIDHAIRVSYSSPQLQRVFKINPDVSAWCP